GNRYWRRSAPGMRCWDRASAGPGGRATGRASIRRAGCSCTPMGARWRLRPGRFTLSERKRHALELFAGLPSRYDRVGAIMSFGQDPRWRTTMIRAVDPQPGQRVLDVATGTG